MRKWKSFTLFLEGGKLRGNRQREARYRVCHSCEMLAGALHIAVPPGKAVVVIFFWEWVSTNYWLKLPTNCVGKSGKFQPWQLMVSCYAPSKLQIEWFCLTSIWSLHPKTEAWGWLWFFVTSSSTTKNFTT